MKKLAKNIFKIPSSLAVLRLKFWAIFALFFLPLNGFADSTSGTTTTTSSTSSVATAKPANPPSFFGSASYEYDQSAVNQNDGSLMQYQSLHLSLSDRITNNWVLTGRLAAEQDLRNAEAIQDNGLSDTEIIVSRKPIPLASWLSGSVKVEEVLPTSRYSQSQLGLESATGADLTLGLNPAWYPTGLMTAFIVGGSRNFHQYTTDSSGSVLNPWSVRESVFVAYTWKKITLDGTFLHRSAWDYNDNVTEDFEHSEEISYQITNSWLATLGLTNRGPWTTPNGVDSNLKLLDENASIFYASLAWKF